MTPVPATPVPGPPFPGPRWCLTPDRIAAVDRAAIDGGLAGAALMETAGRAVADQIRARWPRPGRAVVLIGSGNNGGDGLVAARHLAGAGWRVELGLFTDPDRWTGDAAAEWRLVAPLGLPADRVERPAEARGLVERAAGATCIVDALLGTGLRGEVREPMRSAIRALAASEVPVVAVDAPSGLDGASGQVRGAAAPAAMTVTFGFPKPGLFLGDGPGLVGRLTTAPLGYPPSALAAAGDAPLGWIGLDEAAAALPPRRHDLHKGQAGRLLAVAGSRRYAGAAVLTATAALRAGAGLCVVATTDRVADRLAEAVPEAIAERLPSDRAGSLAARGAEAAGRAADAADALALGPGLTAGAGVRRVVAAALASGRPAVVDADALNALAADPAPICRDAPTILTPHPGELGRWLGRPAREVDASRIDAAREAAGRWGVIVALKGSPTVVADPGGGAALNLTGNPGLATGGSGDVLTGIVGALLAQGVAPLLAVRAGVLLHGLAADWAAADLGPHSLLPSDLFRYLPLVVREVSAGRGAELVARLDHPYAALLTAGEGAA